MRDWSPSTVFVAVVAITLVVAGLDLGAPSEATSRPDPSSAGPAVAGAWYCAAAATDEESSTTVQVASPPDQSGISTVELSALTGGAVTGLPDQRVFPGAGQSVSLPADSPSVGVAARWDGQPSVVSRVWELGAADLPPGLVSGPCISSPSSTWYVPGMTTAGGARARLHLFNPFTTDASVAIAFTTPTGLEEPIRLENVSVSPRSTTIIEVNEHLPLEPDLGAVVTSRSGRVVVEGVQLVDAAIDGVDGASLIAAAPRTAETWTIPWSIGEPGVEADVTPAPDASEEPTEATSEAADAPSEAASDDEDSDTGSPDVGPVPTPYPGDGTASWVWVSNPTDREASITLTLHTRVGALVPDVGDQLLVGAGEVLRIDLRGVLPPDVATAGVTVRSENGVGVVAGVASLFRPESSDPATTGLSTILGSPSPDTGWVLPGERVGTRRQVVHVVNPGAEDAVVDLVLWNGSLVRRLEPLSDLLVPAGGMIDVDVTAALVDAPEAVIHVVASEGQVVAGRHSVSEAGQRNWVVSGGVGFDTWSGGDAVLPVDHAPNLVRELGTGRGVRVTEVETGPTAPPELEDLLDEASERPGGPTPSSVPSEAGSDPG